MEPLNETNFGRRESVTGGAVHERLGRGSEAAGSSDRSFGLVFAVVFTIVGLWPAVFGDGGLRWWAFVVAGLFLALAVLRPALLAPLNRLWTRIGLVLHRIVNPVIMGLIFYLVITPVALAMRLAGRDALRLKSSEAAESYWIDREPPGPAPESMNDPF